MGSSFQKALGPTGTRMAKPGFSKKMGEGKAAVFTKGGKEGEWRSQRAQEGIHRRRRDIPRI